MCGIAGVIEPAGKAADRSRLQAMAGKVRHRGPDAEGVWVDGSVGFGHARLSIIDLTLTGAQPMSFADGKVWLTYNGEVYNFREIRKDLEAKGVRFRGTSDTEVIGEAYLAWGIDCIQLFQGMFAFGLWDGRDKSLYLVRDRVGIKPLYYYWDGKRLLFASEIKAILADGDVPRVLDPAALGDYLTFGNAIAPLTMYKGIQKVRPGHFILLHNGALQEREYWDVPGVGDPRPRICSKDTIPDLRAALEEAVSSHLVADVPVGAFLSGGIDSAAVATFMSRHAQGRVNTFSVGFKEGRAYDETAEARALAEAYGCEHHELLLGEKDLVAAHEKLAYFYDEPFGDAAAFPTLLLSEFARRTVKVVLTGEGGDEIFGGYRRYVLEGLGGAYRCLPGFIKSGLAPAMIGCLPRMRRSKKAVLTMREPNGSKRNAQWLTFYDRSMLDHLLRREWVDQVGNGRVEEQFERYYSRAKGLDPVSRAMYLDLKLLLPNIYLEKVDKATMAASLEARVPLLDHRLIEKMYQLPGSVKVSLFKKKVLFREALRGLVPDSVFHRPKHGFAVPTDTWFRGKLLGYVQGILLDPKAVLLEYFNKGYIEKLLQEHKAGREVRDWPLWLLMNFELWHRQFIGKDKKA